MAAKVPDNVTTPPMVRHVIGDMSLYILNFLTEDLDNNDTIDVSSILSSVVACWVQCTSASNTSAPGLAMSGTGNVTLTFLSAVDNLHYQVFVVGTP